MAPRTSLPFPPQASVSLPSQFTPKSTPNSSPSRLPRLMSVVFPPRRGGKRPTTRRQARRSSSLDRISSPNCNSPPRAPYPCGRWAFFNAATGDVRAFACQGWRCPCCAPRKARRLRGAVAQAAQQFRLTRLLTLTLPSPLPAELSEGPRGERAERYLMRIWAKFRVYLSRRYRLVDFVWVKEVGSKGRLHLHVLVSRYLPQAWISETWARLGGGYVVDIRHVDVHRVAAYLAKYLTKGFYQGIVLRRYGTSRGIDLRMRGASQKGSWYLVKIPPEAFRLPPGYLPGVAVLPASGGETWIASAPGPPPPS